MYAIWANGVDNNSVVRITRQNRLVSDAIVIESWSLVI